MQDAEPFDIAAKLCALLLWKRTLKTDPPAAVP